MPQTSIAIQLGRYNKQFNFVGCYDHLSNNRVIEVKDNTVNSNNQYEIVVNFAKLLSYRTSLSEFNRLLCDRKPNGEITANLKKEIEQMNTDNNMQLSDEDQLEIIDNLKQLCGKILADSDKGYSIMGDSLLNSCYELDKQFSFFSDAKASTAAVVHNLHQPTFDAVKRYATKGKGVKEFFVFLSALSHVANNNVWRKTQEYFVARILKYSLERRGIHAFWWEDSKLDNNVLISAKIASGLAFSSIFVGLAFDTVSTQNGQSYNYLCLSEEERIPNCFRYEVETFRDLMDSKKSKQFCYLPQDPNKSTDNKEAVNQDNQIKNSENTSAEKPTNDVGSQPENDKKPNDISVQTPSHRKFMFVTYGYPEKFDEEHNAALFDGYDDNIRIVKNSSGGINVEISDKVRQILGYIFDAIVSEKEDKNYQQAYSSWKHSEHYKKMRKEINGDLSDSANEKKAFCTLDSDEIAQIEKLVGRSDVNMMKALFAPYDPKKVDDTFCDNFILGDKENDAMIPSDILFQYAVIDETGKNAKNHFLVFPEYAYDENGQIKWSLKLVIRDWNFEGVRIKAQEEANKKDANKRDTKADIEIFKSKVEQLKKNLESQSKLINYNYVAIGDKRINQADYQGNGGVFTLGNNLLSMDHHQGVFEYELVFCEHKHRVPDVSYYLKVIFLPKKIIRYTVQKTAVAKREDENVDSKKKLTVKDRKISRNYRAYAKFLDKFAGELKIYVDGSDEPQSVYYGKRLLLKSTDSALKLSEDCAKYFLLVKEYDEEHSRESEVSSNVGNKCLYCGKVHENDYCPNNFVYEAFDPKTMTSSGVLVSVGNDQWDYFTAKVGGLAAPKPKEWNQLALPRDYSVSKNAIVSLVGPSQSGKSTFFNGLFGKFRRNSSLSTVSNALAPYLKINKNLFTVLPRDNVSVDKNTLQERLREDYEGSISKWKLDQDYSVDTYNRFIQATTTDPNKDIGTPHIPFVINIDCKNVNFSKAYLALYDLPGGYVGTDNEKKESSYLLDHTEDYTMLTHSDGIILFVNGTQDAKEEHSTKINLALSARVLRDICGVIENSGKLADDFKKSVSLAIVMCKFDEFADKFPEGQYVKMSPPINIGQRYENSLTQEYIDKKSDEIKKWLKTQEGSDSLFEVIEGTKNIIGFPNTKFFAISAVGRSETIYQISDIPSARFSLFHAEQRGIEEVLLWMMYRQGIVR